MNSIYYEPKGKLLPVEFSTLPFEPKRVFVVSDIMEQRGGHAHYQTQQVLLCVQGTIKVEEDDGNKKESFILGRGSAFLHKNLRWLTYESMSGVGTMVSFCSHPYSAKDYIRDYEKFLKVISGK